ncbi:hypothetical protein Tsubulata_043628 [Turnera subulata]|uniref:Peptidase C1A papain C-terminal domain-containing protein n=1 Tax=Turnera subulata TaxID=218843 RepID=A0A9Q0G933_9ROSI|nr:hypothetical protein Tsubulata_043628 [Turnera subulata]
MPAAASVQGGEQRGTRRVRGRVICWAIAVAHVVEALYNKYNPENPVMLSPQELINNALEEKQNRNPKSGQTKAPEKNPTRLKPVFDYIKFNGLSKEEDCPFHPKEVDKRNCKKSDNPVYIAEHFEVADDVDETQLLARVAEHPVVGSIVSHPNFDELKKGEYYEGVPIDLKPEDAEFLHCILIVGYGTDYGPDGEAIHYWLVRNSDGETWADKGYGKIKRKISMEGKKSVFLRYSYPIMPWDVENK